MTPEELKVYKKERMDYWISGLRKETGKDPETPGGQSCGMFPSVIRLIHDDLNFEIKVDGGRSQLKNLKFAVTVFELFIEEFNIY
jgi:protein subunit release factor A